MWLVSAASGVREVFELHDFSAESAHAKNSLLRRFEERSAIIAMLQRKWQSGTRGL